MDVHLTIIFLLVLIVMSAFFSSAETGMMSLNRYRLKHLTRKNNKKAINVQKMLQRPDRLLGLILLGNTFANLMAAALASLLAVHYLGDAGAVFATVILTLIILVFAETMPKTLAAAYPMRVAFAYVPVLRWLLKVFYPLVWLINITANSLLRLMRIKVGAGSRLDAVNHEELRSLVHEAGGGISFRHQQMLLRMLDFPDVTVNDVMVPRNQVYGLDISDSWEEVKQRLLVANHVHVPLYFENIDQVMGMVNVRHALMMMVKGELDQDRLESMAMAAYFVPENASLTKQLVQFQGRQCFSALVVDEYGDIQGMVTIKDILEEIVGEFVHDTAEVGIEIERQPDGSYVIDAGITVRDLNRLMGWGFSTAGANTISGVITEQLQMLPTSPICLYLFDYPVEVVKLSQNKIALVRIWPNLKRKSKADS